MDWSIDPTRPAYLQIAEKIEHLVLVGHYKPGSRFPSVKEMAAEVDVNPNTMQRTLKELESRGILYTKRAKGRFVTEDVGMLREKKKALALELTRGYVDTLAGLEFDFRDSVELLCQLWPKKGEAEGPGEAGPAEGVE